MFFLPSFQWIDRFYKENSCVLFQVYKAGRQLVCKSLTLVGVLVHFVAPSLGPFVL